MTLRANSPVACVVAAAMLVAVPPVEAKESLATAAELYAAANYTDALAILNRLVAQPSAADERRSIELYRTLCLLALGRRAEADRAVEAMVARDPMYRPTSDDIPPRLRSAFSEARRRLLPSIIQQKYNDARAAFDRKDYEAAVAEFKHVLESLGDPDLAAIAGQPPLSDLRTLADGFHDLSVKAVVPVRPGRSTGVAAAPSRIYSAEDKNVVPPLTIRQQIPPFRDKVVKPALGLVELIVGVTGEVESARMSVPLTGRYDALVLAAARTWLYQPAKLNGVPVKFRKFVRVSLVPTPSRDDEE